MYLPAAAFPAVPAQLGWGSLPDVADLSYCDTMLFFVVAK